MKVIEVDDELYAFIASHTKTIGESASDILRRLLYSNTPKTKIESKKIKTGSMRDKLSLTKLGQELESLNSVTKRFMFIVERLLVCHPTEFELALELKGAKRAYFARNSDTLLKASSSCKPRQIGDSGYWVVTNTNTEKKKRILQQLTVLLGYSDEEATKIADTVAGKLKEQ